MMLAAMLAMVGSVAVPAIAQVGQENEQETESGDFSVDFSIENTGDYGGQCTPVSQVGDSGNFQNGSGALQTEGVAGDIEPGGIEVGFGGSMGMNCERTIQQSSAASSKAAPAAPKAAPPPPPKAAAPPPPPPPPKVVAPPPPPTEEMKQEGMKQEEMKQEGMKKEEMKKEEEEKELPKSGGSGGASLLALGAGALLIGGGLLARRIVR
jgi:LPXTG-motif cell wall-anchored protein